MSVETSGVDVATDSRGVIVPPDDRIIGEESHRPRGDDTDSNGKSDPHD